MGSTERSTDRLTTGLVITFILAVLALAGYPLVRGPALPSLASPVTTATVSDSSILAAQHQAIAEVQYKAAVLAWRAQQVAAAKPKVTVAAPIVTPAPAVTPAVTPSYPVSSGSYSYAGLEALWVANGGSVAREATAACIAEHESSGVADAFNGRDIGLWQIDPAHDPGGNLYNANENARIAVQVSSDGSDWSQWTTAPDCGV